MNIKIKMLAIMLCTWISAAAAVPLQAVKAEQAAAAQTGVTGNSSHRLTSMLNTALKENPGIRAAFEAYKKEVENYRVETGLPDPQISMT